MLYMSNTGEKEYKDNIIEIDVEDNEDDLFDFEYTDDLEENEDDKEMDNEEYAETELEIENNNDFYESDDNEKELKNDLEDIADLYGSKVNPLDEGLLDEDYDINTINNEGINSFINKDGDIYIMDSEDNGDSFELKYIAIENIAVVRRIRKNRNVEDLVTSIRSTGLVNPLIVAPTVTEGIYVLISGFRRLLACAKAGIIQVPCVINKKVNTIEIPILESLYNHCKPYNMQETLDYIEYLEKEKGIMSPPMIEYLLQLNNGDYTKLKDILNDNDDDIISRLMSGEYDISKAFKKLEKRRKDETKEEQTVRNAETIYSDSEGHGVKGLENTGETGYAEDALTDEEIKELALNANEWEDGLEDASLEAMIHEDKQLDGFKDKKQDVDNREETDPIIRRQVFVRDGYKCQCCDKEGPSYIDVLECHHMIPVFVNKGMTAEKAGDVLNNLITLCIMCHRMVHLYSFGDLAIPETKNERQIAELTSEERVRYFDEQMKFKKIVKLGGSIRKLMVKQGVNVKEVKKKNSPKKVGKMMPGFRNNIDVNEVKKA